MPQLFGLLIIGAGISVALLLVFWPFVMMQEYLLLTAGIDKYSTLPIVLGLLAEIFYLGSFAYAVAPWLSTANSTQEESTPSNARPSKHPTVGRRVLGVSIFAGTTAILLMIILPSSGRSGDEIYATVVDKCEEEVTGDRYIYTLTRDQRQQVDECVERKLD